MAERCCDLIWGLACFIIMVAVVLSVVLLVGPQVSDPENNPFTPQEPPGKDESMVWFTARNQNSLRLVLRNSLQERYFESFDRYVQEWNSGTPNVLDLSIQQGSWDPTCQAVRGIMNVCNADFGRTDWRGINEILLENNYIVSSVAKMNDFFLDKETDNHRLYTMCHEIGHGFGLPHTDVNYLNRDRGDCLDYTITPRNNLHPGQYNFDLLNQLYAGGPPPVDVFADSPATGNNNNSTGTSEGVGAILDSINDIIITVVDSVSDGISELYGAWESDQNRRRLRTRYHDDIPHSIRVQYEQVTAFLEQTNDPDEMASRGAEIVHQDEFSEAYQFDLGMGYAVRVSKLLVPPGSNY